MVLVNDTKQFTIITHSIDGKSECCLIDINIVVINFLHSMFAEKWNFFLNSRLSWSNWCNWLRCMCCCVVDGKWFALIYQEELNTLPTPAPPSPPIYHLALQGLFFLLLCSTLLKNYCYSANKPSIPRYDRQNDHRTVAL